MPNLKENPRDRVLLAYEKELLDQIYGRNAAFPESSRQRAEELADEFCQTFLGNGDPAGQEVRQALNGIALNGRPFPFFRDDLAVQGELSREQSRRIMAYAMLKIRQEVLYTENPKIPDGRNHVVFRGADGRAQSLVREEAVQLSPPVRPQELGGWKAFANRVFGAYKEETAAYEAGRLEYEEKSGPTMPSRPTGAWSGIMRRWEFPRRRRLLQAQKMTAAGDRWVFQSSRRD